MLKRVAVLGSVAALMIGSAASAGAQGWAGGWGGVTVTVSGFPGPYYPPYRGSDWCCYSHYPDYPRSTWCCYGGYYPHRYYRPPYFYGDNFAPYAYGYGYGGYNGAYGDGDY
jgi:hypothetical protein